MHLVVDASPLVMAIWSLSAISDIPDRLRREHQAIQAIAGSQHWSRRRGHAHVRTYTRG